MINYIVQRVNEPASHIFIIIPAQPAGGTGTCYRDFCRISETGGPRFKCALRACKRDGSTSSEPVPYTAGAACGSAAAVVVAGVFSGCVPAS